MRRWLGPPLMQWNTLCTSGLMDDVLFSHNEANGPKSKMTHKFRPVRQVSAPGAKSTVSDCIFLVLRFQLIRMMLMELVTQLSRKKSFTLLTDLGHLLQH